MTSSKQEVRDILHCRQRMIKPWLLTTYTKTRWSLNLMFFWDMLADRHTDTLISYWGAKQWW